MSIFLVILLHFNLNTMPGQPPNGLMDWLVIHVSSIGKVGVQLFFIISGFVLGLPFARHFLAGARAVSIKSYFKRRVTRLEPPYVLNLIICGFIIFIILHRSFHIYGAPLLASIFYSHSLIYHKMSIINPVTWSLEVEIQFYILAPFLARIFSVKSSCIRRGAIVSVIALFIILPNLLPLHHYLYNLSLLGSLQYFLTGFLLVDFFVKTWERSGARPFRALWDVFGLLTLAGLFVVWISNRYVEYLFPGLAFLFFASVFQGRLLRSFFSNIWITTIGGMCYSIYLYHYLITAHAEWILGWLVLPMPYWCNFIAHFVLHFMMILMFCGAFFVFIEKPCMNPAWPNRLTAWFRARARVFRGAHTGLG
jgi:peptidoglycan/LPS O-acetylase OafA/YrhL